jgi:predicted dehydrogenase
MAKVRWGLIGCGDIVRKRVARALHDLTNCQLVAVSRARAELSEAFAREVGAPKWYRGWQELLLDEELDAVYIATPVHLHAAQTIAVGFSTWGRPVAKRAG